MNPDCILCHMRRNVEIVRDLGTPEQLNEFTKGLLELYLRVPEGISAVWTGPETDELYERIYGITGDRYKEEKEASNRFVVERLDRIRAEAETAEDPVYAGLQLAVLGNYIDFSALGRSVSFEQLEQMLLHPEKFTFDHSGYAAFCADIEKAHSLLYITDNAGELGFDWVLADELVRRWPQLKITFCVRGMPAYNDAIREDYDFMGIPYPVISNGSDIAGTDLKYVNQETLDALKGSDIILANEIRKSTRQHL